MTDIVTYCDINTCEDCPRYGDDCDGGGDAEMDNCQVQVPQNYMQQSRHDDGTDLINRADAIRQIKEEIKDFEANYMHDEEDDENYGHDIGFVAGLHRAKALIKELPSADAVQGWITDRNPTEDGTYLVTIVDEDGGFVCELHYGEPLLPICKVNGSCWYDSDDEFGDCPHYDIIAW